MKTKFVYCLRLKSLRDSASPGNILAVFASRAQAIRTTIEIASRCREFKALEEDFTRELTKDGNSIINQTAYIIKKVQFIDNQRKEKQCKN